MNAHCYWLLRKLGRSAADATSETLRMTSPDKNELLFSNGLNFNDVPSWQKRGVGLFWTQVPKEGIDPRTGETRISQRTKLAKDFDLPLRDNYDKFIRDILEREYDPKR